VPITSANRASSLVMALVTATGFAGGGGWTAGRTMPAAVDVAPAAADAANPDAHAGHGQHHGHHAAHAPAGAAAHHSHDCEKGICRCDSRCPPRRSGPCGGAMRSCSGDGQDAGLGPGPMRPFLLSAVAELAPGFDRLARPDVASTPPSRALDVVSPPPRPSSI
jgi:hypothetical protein